VGVGARNSMCYAKRGKILIVEFLIFPTLIGLNTFNLRVKEPFNMSLKLHEDALSISSVIHEINPFNLLKSSIKLI